MDMSGNEVAPMIQMLLLNNNVVFQDNGSIHILGTLIHGLKGMKELQHLSWPP
jgi:hypothetical protein